MASAGQGGGDSRRGFSARGAPLHAGHVGLAIGRAGVALRVGQHLAQAFHHLVVRRVQIAPLGGQQFHRLPYAARLIDAALLADRQVHRQVQERVAAHRAVAIVACDGDFGVLEIGMPFGVLGNPGGGQGFNGFHRLARA